MSFDPFEEHPSADLSRQDQFKVYKLLSNCEFIHFIKEWSTFSQLKSIYERSLIGLNWICPLLGENNNSSERTLTRSCPMLLELSVMICLQAVVLKQQEDWSCHKSSSAENRAAIGNCCILWCWKNGVDLSTPWGAEPLWLALGHKRNVYY